MEPPGQNVACDPCKLRRLKCHLLALLTSTHPDSNVEAPSPHTLARNNPTVHCLSWGKKALRCTKEGIINPGRPNKGGRSIEEARRVFGVTNEEDPDTTGSIGPLGETLGGSVNGMGSHSAQFDFLSPVDAHSQAYRVKLTPQSYSRLSRISTSTRH